MHALEMISTHPQVRGSELRTGAQHCSTLSRVAAAAVIVQGAVMRVRPKMMTVVAIMAGLLPIMWSTGTGSEVMRRVAAPMVGGMVSATILTLVVIPTIFALVAEARLKTCGNTNGPQHCGNK